MENEKEIKLTIVFGLVRGEERVCESLNFAQLPSQQHLKTCLKNIIVRNENLSDLNVLGCGIKQQELDGKMHYKKSCPKQHWFIPSQKDDREDPESEEMEFKSESKLWYEQEARDFRFFSVKDLNSEKFSELYMRLKFYCQQHGIPLEKENAVKATPLNKVGRQNTP